VTLRAAAGSLTPGTTTFSVLVGGSTPSINDVADQTIAYGTATVTLSGTVAAGSTYPANGEIVWVTINGSTEPAPIAGGAGEFSVDFPTDTIPVSTTPYPITYHYGGNATLSVADNTATTLTVLTALSGSSSAELPGFTAATIPVAFVATAIDGTTVLGSGVVQVTTSDSAGGKSFTFTVGVPAGTAYISLKPRFYLRQKFALPDVVVDQSTMTLTLTDVSFVGGDADSNNQVDGNDYAWIRTLWGTSGPLYDINKDGIIDANDFPDLNGDGVIDALDYAILKDGWYQQGDPE
jgi:hypothetical protein